MAGIEAEVEVVETLFATTLASMSRLIFLGGGLTTEAEATFSLVFFLFSFSMTWSSKSIDRPTHVGLPMATLDDDDDDRGGDTMGMVILGGDSVELIALDIIL